MPEGNIHAALGDAIICTHLSFPRKRESIWRIDEPPNYGFPAFAAMTKRHHSLALGEGRNEGFLSARYRFGMAPVEHGADFRAMLDMGRSRMSRIFPCSMAFSNIVKREFGICIAIVGFLKMRCLVQRAEFGAALGEKMHAPVFHSGEQKFIG